VLDAEFVRKIVSHQKETVAPSAASMQDNREMSSLAPTLGHARRYLSANLVSAAAGLVYLPFLTHTLTPEEYGIWTIFMSWIPILAVFLTLDTTCAIDRYAYDESVDFGRFLGTTMVFLLMVLFPMSTATIIFRDQISPILGLPSRLVPFLLVAVLVFIYKGLFWEISIAGSKSRMLSRITVLITTVSLLLTVVLTLLLDTDRYRGPVYASVAISAISGVYFLTHLVRMSRLPFSTRYMTMAVAYSLPLVFHHVSVHILERIDVIMIGRIAGAADAGLYGYSYRIGSSVWLFVSALYVAWRPAYYSYMNAGDVAGHDRDLSRILWMITSVSCGIIMFGCDLGRIISSGAFHEGLYIVPLVVAGYYFLALCETYKRHMSFIKKTYLLIIPTVVSGVANLLLNAIFIPKYGYAAASVTTLVAYALQFLVGALIVEDFMHFREMPWRDINLMLLCIAVFSSVTTAFSYARLTIPSSVALKLSMIAVGLFLGRRHLRRLLMPIPRAA